MKYPDGTKRIDAIDTIVTDKKLIEEMKESNPTFFLEVGLSVMTLRRYDGDLFKTNLSAT